MERKKSTFQDLERRSLYTEIRLSKFLALCGLGSRRKNKELILSGRITINGEVVTDLSRKVNPERDRVFFDGKELKVPPKVYYLFYKPRGYLTSLYDPHHRKTIRVFLEKIPYRVFPVGRLDKESEGLLLLTNDGDLANVLLHPRFEISRIYHVWVKPDIPQEKLQTLLKKGLTIDGRTVKPVKFTFLRRSKEGYVYEVEIKEGVKREIRKMVSHLGSRVERLVRVAFGPIGLRDLKPGEIRPLSEEELQRLIEFVQKKKLQIFSKINTNSQT